jgi:hypothetical protein
MGIMWHQSTAPSGDDHGFRADGRQSVQNPAFCPLDGSR